MNKYLILSYIYFKTQCVGLLLHELLIWNELVLYHKPDILETYQSYYQSNL
jgi:hypothetical protein